jgi:hypothetical protein
VQSLDEKSEDLCKDFLHLITKHLYLNAKKQKNVETMLYLRNLPGDYFKHVAEVSTGDRHKEL